MGSDEVLPARGFLALGTNPNDPGYGPGPNLEDDDVDGPMGPYYEDDSSSDGPAYGPGPGEPQEDSGDSQPRFKWPWDYLRKDSQSGGKH